MNKNNSQAVRSCGIWRRILSLLLSACMVISLTTAAMAEGIPAAQDIMQPAPAQSTAPAEDIPQDDIPAEPEPDEAAPAEAEPVVTAPAAEGTVSEDPRVQLIKELISALPAEVTVDNADEVRASLDEILSLYSQLDEAEQELVDITPCYMLQMQLGELDSVQTLEETPGITVDENGVTTINLNEVTNERVSIPDSGIYIIVGDGTEVKKYITVAKNTSPTITLRNVNIKSPNADNPPFSAGFGSSGTVTIILEGNNILTTYGGFNEHNAALQMSSGQGATGKPTGKLIIKEGSDGGSLTAIGSSVTFGIGGPATNLEMRHFTNDIIIESGTIIAKCSDGGYGGGIGGIDCDITINGGTIEAYTTERYSYPCIGTAHGGSVTINGGNIKAVKSGSGACIGGDTYSCTVNITGGTIEAANTGDGTCIGSEGYDAPPNIKITGGIINATGAKHAIGYNSYTDGTIEISGGVVNAYTTDSSGVGIGGTKMTFTTGANGHAIINASSISDQTGKESWSGIIFEGDTGVVYGNQTLTESMTLETGKILTVNAGASLTVPEGAALTSNGTIAIEYGGEINGNGTITGSGSFTTENLTQDMIIVPAYNGKDRSSEIRDGISFAAATVCGQEFTFDSSKWKIGEITTDDNFNYNVVFVYNGTERKTFSIRLAKSGTEFAEGSAAAYRNDEAATEFSYGETITIKADPVPTGEPPVMLASTFSLTAPTTEQMAVYYGDTQVSEAVDVGEDGYYIMTVPVSKLIEAGAPYDTSVTLTAKFVGNDMMADAAAEISVTLHKASITINAAAIADKVYDGNALAAVESVTFIDSNGNVVPLVIDTDYTATARFTDVDGKVGNDKAVMGRVDGIKNPNYTLEYNTFETTGNITPRELTNNDVVIEFTNGDTFTWAGEEIRPEVTVSYKKSAEDTSATLIPEAEYTVSYNNNGGEGRPISDYNAPYVEITFNEGSNFTFNGWRLSKVFTIICEHKDGFVNGRCRICDKQMAATVEIDGVINAYDDIVSAWKAADGKTATITMYQDQTISETLNMTSGNITLKMSSSYMTLSDPVETASGYDLIHVSNGTLTLDGCSLISQNAEAACVYVGYDTLNMPVVNIRDCSISSAGSTSAVYVEQGSVNIYGGTLRAQDTAGCSLKIRGSEAAVKLYGGSFTGSGTAIIFDGSGTLPSLSSLPADGYTLYHADTGIELTDAELAGTSIASGVFVEKAGARITGELDLTSPEGESGGGNGYSWKNSPNSSGENDKIFDLYLDNCTIPGNIALPDNRDTITIHLTGDTTVGGFVSTRRPKYEGYEEYRDADYNYNIAVTGEGTLTIGGIFGGAGADNSYITIDPGAAVNVNGGLQIGASGGVNGYVIVNGSLKVSSKDYYAISAGKLTIGSTGRLEVYGSDIGVSLNPSYDYSHQDDSTIGYTDTFKMEAGAIFIAECTGKNISINGDIPKELAANSVINIPDGYIPQGYAIRRIAGEYGDTIALAPESLTDDEVLNNIGTGGRLVLGYQPYKVEVVDKEYVCTEAGQQVIPEITVTDTSTNTPLDASAYTVTYENNTAPGTGKVTVTINGDITITKTFMIICGHPGFDPESGKCYACNAQIDIAVELPDDTSYRYYTDFIEAWNFAASAETADPYSTIRIYLFKDLIGSGNYSVTVPEGKMIEVVAGGSAWSNASIRVDGNLYIQSRTDNAAAGNIVVSPGGNFVLMDASIGSITVESGAYAVLNYGCVNGRITVEGGKIRDILAEGHIYRQYGSSGYGWLTEEELNQSSYQFAVEIVPVPVVIYHHEADLVNDYIVDEQIPISLSAQFDFPTEEMPGPDPAEPTYPEAKIQWYETAGDNTAGSAVDGQTAETFTPDITDSGTYKYYYTVTVEGYTATSPVFTVNARKRITVAASSQLDDTTETIVPVTGGDRYLTGDTVTVEAPAKDGCRFIGWFEKDGESPSCTFLTYTFTAEKDVELVARYEANENAEVTIEGLTPASFFVSGDAAEQTSFKKYLAIGTKLTLTAKEPEKVSAWLNSSDKIIGTGGTIEITVTGAMTIKLMYKADTANQAMVEYVSDYGQLLSYKSYTADAEIAVPTAPSKLGYTFDKWSLTVDEIKAQITAGTKHITVRPVYTRNDKHCKVTVKYPEGTLGDTIVSDWQGNGVPIRANDIEGKVFSHWADEAGNILSYEQNYFIQLTSDITLYAIYADEAVEAQPIIAITAKYADVVDGKNKVSFAATRSVPENYTVVEQGILFGTDSSLNDESALILGGANVKKSMAKSTSNNGIYDMNVTVGTKTNVKIYVRGYMIIRNSQTNNIETVYSGIDSGSFDELNK